MRKITFIAMFIFVHILFFMLQIYKESKIIEITYQKQKHDRQKSKLLNEKEDLLRRLYFLQNRSHIKKFAMKNLGMKKIRLSQIKKLKK